MKLYVSIFDTMNVFDCDSYSFWLLKGVDTEQLYMLKFPTCHFTGFRE